MECRADDIFCPYKVNTGSRFDFKKVGWCKYEIFEEGIKVAAFKYEGSALEVTDWRGKKIMSISGPHFSTMTDAECCNFVKARLILWLAK